MTTNTECIFCNIVSSKLPSHRLYEDSDFLAFLDINPRSPGHALIIPKAHYQFVWDVPNAGAYFEVAKKIARAQQKAFNTDMVWSRISGEDVPHAHIWILPGPKTNGNAKDLVGNAEKIKLALQGHQTSDA